MASTNRQTNRNAAPNMQSQTGGSTTTTTAKRGRGRPRGSTKNRTGGLGYQGSAGNRPKTTIPVSAVPKRTLSEAVEITYMLDKNNFAYITPAMFGKLNMETLQNQHQRTQAISLCDQMATYWSQNASTLRTLGTQSASRATA